MATAAPIVVPVLVAPVAYAASMAGFSFLAAVAVVLGFAVLIAGVPYAAFVGCLLWHLRGSPDASYRRAALLAPVFFAPLLAVLVGAFAILKPSGMVPLEGVVVGAYYGAWALGVGYF